MKFRFGIRTKLIGIINTILVVAAAAIVVFATSLFSEDNVKRVQENNLDSARLLAQEVNNDIVNLTEKMRLLGVSLLQPLSAAQLETLQRPFFERETDLLAEAVIALPPGGAGKPRVLNRAANEALLKTLDIPLEDVLLLQQTAGAEKVLSGEENGTIQSGQLKGSVPVLTLTIPLLSDDKGGVTHAVIATLKQDRFLKAVKSDSIITSYLVDAKGYLLAHKDAERVLKHENLTHLEIVKILLSGRTNNGQKLFVDPKTQIPYYGAFKTVGFAGIGVVSQVEEAKALEAARKVKKTSIILTAMVSVIAFLIVYIFSLTLTQPLVRLVEATAQIAQGNYEVDLRKGANDEIGDLTRSFGEMARGLAEREKIKSAFSKFHSKEIAEKILSGSLQLTGERKKVSIFFSDIRSFTSISEKLEPEQVVDLINGYMTRMVRIIFAHGGVVDKYVGDAIMAVYGTPIPHEDDSIRAVSAAIRMRAELKRFNQSQAAQGKPVIAIGMGMHTGTVVAGNIGSPERMEYTILGDNVNLTSRMESLTKEFKTDILISEETYHEVESVIHCEARGTTHVKGKAEEVNVYEVIGFKEGFEYIPAETGFTGESEGLSAPPPPRPEMTQSGGLLRPPPPKPEMTNPGLSKLLTPPPPRAEMTNPGMRIQPPPPTREMTNPGLSAPPSIRTADTGKLEIASFDISAPPPGPPPKRAAAPPPPAAEMPSLVLQAPGSEQGFAMPELTPPAGKDASAASELSIQLEPPEDPQKIA